VNAVCKYCKGTGECSSCEGEDPDDDDYWCTDCYSSQECSCCEGTGEDDDECQHDVPHRCAHAWAVKVPVSTKLRDLLDKANVSGHQAPNVSTILDRSSGEVILIDFPLESSLKQAKNVLKYGIRLRAYVAKEVCAKYKQTKQESAVLQFLVKEMAHEVNQKQSDLLAVELGLKKAPAPKKKLKKKIIKAKKKAKKGKK
jgi:hypothetical protein